MAAAYVMFLPLLLSMAVQFSDGSYCLCNSGVPDTTLQKNIDYACGAGADCTPILQNGACYNPNTIRDHCNYAVNSYYQRRNQATGSCDFLGTASVTSNPPSASSGCVYPSGPSGSSNPTSPTPGGGGGTNTNPGTTIPGGTLSPPGFGLAPGSNGFPDNNGIATLMPQTLVVVVVPLSLVVQIWTRF